MNGTVRCLDPRILNSIFLKVNVMAVHSLIRVEKT